MPLYFVHVDIDYYPYAEAVEAESPEEAVAKLREGYVSDSAAFAVVPVEHVTMLGEEWRVARMLTPDGAEGPAQSSSSK